MTSGSQLVLANVPNLPQEIYLATDDLFPFRVVVWNLDGFNVVDRARNASMRSMVANVLKFCDGVFVLESHVNYSNFMEVVDWARSQALVCFTDFNMELPP